MKCAICKTGETRPRTVTVTLQRGETTVLVKDVSGPAISRLIAGRRGASFRATPDTGPWLGRESATMVL